MFYVLAWGMVWGALKTLSLDLILKAIHRLWLFKLGKDQPDFHFQWLPWVPHERWIGRTRLETGSLIRKLLMGERTDMLQNKPEGSKAGSDCSLEAQRNKIHSLNQPTFTKLLL